MVPPATRRSDEETRAHCSGGLNLREQPIAEGLRTSGCRLRLLGFEGTQNQPGHVLPGERLLLQEAGR